MNAVEFVRNFGWEEAKKASVSIFNGDVTYKREEINIDDLKRLVDSWELVIVWRMPESWRDKYDGDVLGLEGARMYLDMFGNQELVGEELERFKQAIADVESVGGGV